ncbi:MAG: hypothetical protein AB7R67_20120 [Vicinamibacterales bacterium]
MSCCSVCGVDTGKRFARYCDEHRWPRRGKRPRYPLTPERRAYLLEHYDATDLGKAARIASTLAVPRWRVTRWAQELGLAVEARRRAPDWTPADDAFLEEHLGRRHVHWIATRLNRSTTAVVVRSKRLAISRRAAREWWTATQVALGFGVDPSTVARWIRQGKLAATPFGEDHEDRHHAYQVWPADVVRFIADHQAAFSLAKVDQLWFLDLVLHTPPRRDGKAA